MALDEIKRLTPVILKADEESYTAFTAFEGYRPANPACAREQMAQVLDEMHLAQEEEIRVTAELSAARAAARQAEWRFHNAMLDLKAQVVAQYGLSSDEVQALGLKKKSKRQRPGPRSAPSASPD